MSDKSDKKSIEKSRFISRIITVFAVILILSGVILGIAVISEQITVSRQKDSIVKEYENSNPIPTGFVRVDENNLLQPPDYDYPISEDEIMPQETEIPSEPEPTAEKADALLKIPKIDLSIGVFKTSRISQMYRKMKFGAAFYPFSAPAGTLGNTSIASHRTGKSGFFRNINKLKAGDEIILVQDGVSYKYIVEYVEVIMPNDWSYVKETGKAMLTLTSCQVFEGDLSGRRIVVRANLTEIAS